jgi:hypothetical protein
LRASPALPAARRLVAGLPVAKMRGRAAILIPLGCAVARVLVPAVGLGAALLRPRSSRAPTPTPRHAPRAAPAPGGIGLRLCRRSDACGGVVSAPPWRQTLDERGARPAAQGWHGRRGLRSRRPLCAACLQAAGLPLTRHGCPDARHGRGVPRAAGATRSRARRPMAWRCHLPRPARGCPARRKWSRDAGRGCAHWRGPGPVCRRAQAPAGEERRARTREVPPSPARERRTERVGRVGRGGATREPEGGGRRLQIGRRVAWRASGGRSRRQVRARRTIVALRACSPRLCCRGRPRHGGRRTG